MDDKKYHVQLASKKSWEDCYLWFCTTTGSALSVGLEEAEEFPLKMAIWHAGIMGGTIVRADDISIQHKISRAPRHAASLIPWIDKMADAARFREKHGLPSRSTYGWLTGPLLLLDMSVRLFVAVVLVTVGTLLWWSAVTTCSQHLTAWRVLHNL